MYTQVIYLAFVAIGMAIGSVLVVVCFWLHVPEVDGRGRIMALLGWSASAIGWTLLAGYLLAPIWFRVLVR